MESLHTSAINERCFAEQAESLARAVDTGQFASLAASALVGQRRIPGLKLHDDRIRVLETLLHLAGLCAPGPPVSCTHASWPAITSSAMSTASPSSVRPEYAALVERVGKTRHYTLNVDRAEAWRPARQASTPSPWTSHEL